jgi:hypothetical protein
MATLIEAPEEIEESARRVVRLADAPDALDGAS